MRETKYWTWHMAAGVVIFVLLGLHMLIMHTGGITHWFSVGGEAVSRASSELRDGKLFFTLTYILLLGVALYHGLYGLRTILFELTLKRALERTVSVALLVLGVGLFGLGTWAALAAHAIAAGARG